MAFGFQAAARPNPVEIAVDVELQQVARSVPGSARRLRLDPTETRLDEIDPIDEGVDEPDGIIGADIVVDRFGQKKELRAFESGNVRHARFYRDACGTGIPRPSFPTSFRTVCLTSARRRNVWCRMYYERGGRRV